MTEKSILDGVYPVIDRWLGIEDIGQSPHHRHRSAWLQVSEAPAGSSDGYQLITELMVIIEKNWRDAKVGYGKTPSAENWRFVPRTETSHKNNSPEVTLERAIAKLAPDDWANQVPTSSGLCGSTQDKRRAIDLVLRNHPDEFTFIELKINSDTPLFAAMEILIYGILYVFSRQNIDELGYSNGVKELLQAQIIHLRTLAPKKFYGDGGLDWLEKTINDGLSQYLFEQSAISIQMDFGFVPFPDGFEWPRDKSKLPMIMDRVCIV